MFKSAVVLYTMLSISNPPRLADNSYVNEAIVVKSDAKVLSERTFSLENRYHNDYVNAVFKDNILLTLNYLNGSVKNRSDIKWENIEKPSLFIFSLEPGESFAFHDQVLPEYRSTLVKTTNAHFNYQDGFKSDGSLFGDGVCHLASLMYWAAKDAGLNTVAPTDHNFAKINEVPETYGVSIYTLPGSLQKSSKENLYITNNLDKKITFKFDYDGQNLSVIISKDQQ